MPTSGSESGGLMWLIYVCVTVVTWGAYGVLLHTGQVAMGDPVNGRYKAFLMVGVAYFLTAVLAPLAVLIVNGASWSFPAAGMKWSFLAGVLGAIGAFAVLLAFGAKGHPIVVMSLVFAGAPIFNALYIILLHPSVDGFRGLRWQFLAGIALAALGGYLVTKYKPSPGPAKPVVEMVAGKD